MYTDDLANELKKMAGHKWRPANGTEGIIFQETYCENCVQDQDEDNPCEIIGRSMCFDIDSKEYPKEWQIGKDGQPICTLFKSITNKSSGHEPLDTF